MNELEKLEQKYNFEYPPIFKDLYTSGMLDWFRGWNEPWTAGRNWHTEIYPTLLDNPPLLLHNIDFEIFKFEDIDERLDDISGDWDSQFKFVPFGMNGTGDWYALYINSGLPEVPVVYVPHDGKNAHYLAKNMTDFIFRTMLEYVCDVELDDWDSEDNFRSALQAMLKSHSPYLSEKEITILTEIYNRPITKQEYGLTLRKSYLTNGMLGEKELDELLDKTIGFEQFDIKFKYTLD